MKLSDVKISVIVPIYNTEKYLRKCIESILYQTHINLEIFLVDDGSIDTSLEICKEYARIDSRIITMSKRNGGQGSARNLALDSATGDYIGFVDSDDWIEQDMYEFLLKILFDANAEMAQAGIFIAENENSFKNIYKSKEIVVFSRIEAMNSHINPMTHFISQGPVNKLYKKELFNGLRFHTDFYYEDVGLIYQIIDRTSKIVITEIPKYYIRIHSNSTSRSKFVLKRKVLISVYKEMETFLENKEDYSSIVQYAAKLKIGAIFYILGEMYINGLNNEKEIIDDIRDECKTTLYKNKNVSSKHKFLLLLIILYPELYGFLYKRKINGSILCNSIYNVE